MNIFWIFLSFLCCSLVAAAEEQDVTDSPSDFHKCLTPDGKDGNCIALRDCTPLFHLIQQHHQQNMNLTSRGRRFLQRSQCGPRNGTLTLVCCPVIPVNKSNLLPALGQCGVVGEDRIYGGNVTEIDEFPWLTLLQYEDRTRGLVFRCGGSLINDRYVLTAAHCIILIYKQINYRLISVRLGEWNTTAEKDCDEDLCNDPPLDIPIDFYITHESYRLYSHNQYNDIALVRLSRSIRYTQWIQPICLPTVEHLNGASFDGVSLIVAGWGNARNKRPSEIKLKAYVKGVSLQSCNESYKGNVLSLKEPQICAGAENGIDSCGGDSGGPLIGMNRSNPARPYYYLVGVISYGADLCGRDGFPLVHTRVSHYVDWIHDNIWP